MRLLLAERIANGNSKLHTCEVSALVDRKYEFRKTVLVGSLSTKSCSICNCEGNLKHLDMMENENELS